MMILIQNQMMTMIIFNYLFKIMYLYLDINYIVIHIIMIKYKNILDIVKYNCLMIYTQIKLLYIYLFRRIELIDKKSGLFKIHKIKYSNWKFQNNGYLYAMKVDTNNIFCLDYLSRKNIEISDFKIKSRGIIYDYQYKFITNYLNKTSIDVPFYLILDYYFKVQNMRISSNDIQNITFEIDFIDEHKISYNDTKNLTIREIIDRITL